MIKSKKLKSQEPKIYKGEQYATSEDISFFNGFDADTEGGIQSFDAKRLQENKAASSCCSWNSKKELLTMFLTIIQVFLELTELIDVIPRLNERRFQYNIPHLWKQESLFLLFSFLFFGKLWEQQGWRVVKIVKRWLPPVAFRYNKQYKNVYTGLPHRHSCSSWVSWKPRKPGI